MTATNSEKENALRLQILLGRPVMPISGGIYQDVLGTQYEVFGKFAYVTLAENRNIRIFDISTKLEFVAGMVEFLNHEYELDNKLTWKAESFDRLLEIAEKFLARAAKPLHDYITEKRQADYSLAGYDYAFTHNRHAQGVQAGFVVSEYAQDWAEYSGELAEICLALPNLVPYIKDGLIHLSEY
jgi:hypothetical protein